MRTLLTLVTVFGLLAASGYRASGQDSPASVDLLVQKLKSRDEGERFAAILALKKMGPDAKAAIPVLTEVSKNDPEEELRKLAKKCLDLLEGSTKVSSNGASQPVYQRKVDDTEYQAILEALRRTKAEQPVNQRKVDDTAQKAIVEALRRTKKEDDSHFGIAVIHNDAGGPINYEYRIGNGDWQSETLEPGYWKAYYHRYKSPNENHSPELRIRFDSDVRKKVVWDEQKLERRPSPDKNPDHGRHYFFKNPGGGSRISLDSRR